VAAAVVFGQVDAGESHTCGVSSDGVAFCWGLNVEGQTGATVEETCTSAGLAYRCTSLPRAVAGLPPMRMALAGGAFTCGLAADGLAYCWGGNRRGQLGRSAIPSRRAAIPVGEGARPRFRELAVGQFHACGVTSARTVVCWGWNLYGQLGTRAAMSRCTTGISVEACSDVPLTVESRSRFTAVAAGSGHSCALDERGRAWCWGSNTRGQLGAGTVRARADVPVAVAGDHVFRALVAGSHFSCALTPEGEVFCWGDNALGQLGTNPDSTPGTGAPVRVPVEGRVVSLGAGDRHACAILEADRVVCWGNNGAGQLGTAWRTESEPPRAVRGDAEQRQAGR
jgi:alpha-tubulin suppressor-like RCC1 family protein